MSTPFNYKHLYYFWVVAKEGGMSKAADKLDMAVQTVSAQVRELERDLGCELLKPAGRGLALTEAGTVALQQADQIFQLGEALPSLVRDAASTSWASPSFASCVWKGSSTSCWATWLCTNWTW
jgi:LysR family transcriptional activator of nhaA